MSLAPRSRLLVVGIALSGLALTACAEEAGEPPERGPAEQPSTPTASPEEQQSELDGVQANLPDRAVVAVAADEPEATVQGGERPQRASSTLAVEVLQRLGVDVEDIVVVDRADLTQELERDSPVVAAGVTMSPELADELVLTVPYACATEGDTSFTDCQAFAFHTEQEAFGTAFNSVLDEMRDAGEIRMLVTDFGITDEQIDAARDLTVDDVVATGGGEG